jgi:2-amino-4-hydroxy-6-hydroxymethyldihydropteridine diphosphokinase
MTEPTPGRVDVFVAAGSNVDAIGNLNKAIASLRRHYALNLSPAYRNRAVGFDGEDFVNLVVGFKTMDTIDEVVNRLHEAEAECGRPRNAPKWAPRTMDLDLLLYGDLVSDQPGRRVPRADLLVRPYMLRPLAELAPDLRHPVTGKTLKQLWSEFDGTSHAMQPVSLT